MQYLFKSRLQWRCECCAQHGEEIIVLQKRINQIQTDLATTRTQVQEASDKLEETNKRLTTVSKFSRLIIQLLTLWRLLLLHWYHNLASFARPG